MNPNTVFDAVVVVAHANKKNEVKEWVNRLNWDGIQRIETSFINHFGSEDTNYTRAVSKNFWISMSARAMSPGCKVDNMVIFEGEQGQFKSTALSIIGGRWYSEVNEHVGSKDFYLCLQGKLLLEISELDSFKKAESTTIKKVLTCRSDRFRPPYGKNSIDYPRQCVFVGTTNDDAYLKDTTGGRRFWPIKTGNINLSDLNRDRDQLFAEALALFRQGVSWWQVPKEQASLEQENRRQEDPWEAILKEKLQTVADITITEILTRELAVSYDNLSHSYVMRISKILPLLGFEKYQRSDKARTKAWRRAP